MSLESSCLQKQIPCHDCGALEGEFHKPGCDVERCPSCGCQLLTDPCPYDRPQDGLGWKFRKPYDGYWPNSLQCLRYGLAVKWDAGQFPKQGGRGWVKCSPAYPEANPDINSLVIRGTWSIEKQEWIIQELEECSR
jgi:hypothetical protein